MIDGRNAVALIPADRWDQTAIHAPWPGAPGRSYVDRAGLIEGVDQFDAGFFGISPREADQMDPQQRLLLETAWEALEAAGDTRASLAGSRTGVYIAISSVDYARITPADPQLLDAYAATGNAASIAANRLSYAFDLRGPSLAIDTACSSSLVALHTACRALAAGDIDRAVVGGVNLLLAPDLMIAFSAARMMAPDGRCKTFDAQADGYVRGEGCGVVVLRRLADLAAEDPLIAVVRGTACNQDGRSNGLTAPNGQAQQAVIAAALADAALAPAEIDAVELHGTGTSLGDPIEAQALSAALQGGPERAPIAVGSVKTNIGHLEAAAGMAGLLKAALALREGVLPASLHFQAPNPEIPLEKLGLRMATAPSPLPNPIARIGVSSFGFGGTNAHAILETAPPRGPRAKAVKSAPLILPLSAHTETALRALAADWSLMLEQTAPEALPDLLYTAAVRRTRLDHRLAAVGADAPTLADRLARFARGEDASGIHSGRRRPAGPGQLAFVLGPLGPVDPEAQSALAQRFQGLAATLAEAGQKADPSRALLAALAAEVRGWTGIATAVGAGPGQPIARWLRSEITLPEALASETTSTDAASPGKRLKLLGIGTVPAGLALNFALDRPEAEALANLAAALHAAGHDLNWESLQPKGRVVPLPRTQWQHQRHWFAGPARMVAPPGELADENASAGELTFVLDWRALPGEISATIRQRLDDICAAYSLAALRRLGWAPDHQPATPEALADRLGIVASRRPAFGRILARLGRSGLVTGTAAKPAPAAEALASLRADCPGLSAELELLQRTGEALATVLNGTTDPLALLFPAGDMSILQRLYRDSPGAQRANLSLARAVRAAADAMPGDRPLRILEIGAGTGGSTDAVLAALGERGADYMFTDQSDHFLAAARTRFADKPLATRRLDIELPPADQGFDPGSFDLVIAANVLHATRNLGETLAHCRTLVAPGGTLVLLETTSASWPMELTFGLTDGWSRFRDRSLRAEEPLLAAPDWLTLLHKSGFAGAQALPCDSHGQQAVISAHLGEAASPECWLLHSHDAEAGEALARAVRAHGRPALYLAAPTTPAALARAAGGAPALVIDFGKPRDGAADACAEAARTIRACVEAGTRYLCLTRNATGEAPDPAQSALWGLGRSVARELPRLWAGLLDVTDPTPEALARALFACATHGGAEREFALKDGGLMTPVLRRAPSGQDMPPLDPAGTFLVTGGLGALGLCLAEWLVSRGARHLALTARRTPDAAQSARIAALCAHGATVDIMEADVSRAEEVEALVARLAAGPAPLRGVVHAAGSHEDSLLVGMSDESLRQVMAAKVTGAEALDKATRALPLQVFLLVSSAAAVAGMPGAASYTAANAVLDAIARCRHAQGLPATSVALGPLAGVGMEARVSDLQRSRWAAFGIAPTATGPAMAAVGRLVGLGLPHGVILTADWQAAPGGARDNPLLAVLLDRSADPVPTLTVAKTLPADTALKGQLSAAFPIERPAMLRKALAEVVAQILHFPPGTSPDTECSLHEQGMDSLMALELHGKLQALTGLALPPTLLLETPSLRALADDLAGRLSVPVSDPPPAPSPPPETVRPRPAGASGRSLEGTIAALAALSDDEAMARLLGSEVVS